MMAIRRSYPDRPSANGKDQDMEATNPLYRFQEQGEMSGVVDLTAKDAARIVEHMGFENQRRADRTHVANLKNYMEDGEWIEPSNIVFSANGDGRLRLVDGQHRLRAFIEYATDCDLRAADGADPVTFKWSVTVTDANPANAYAALDSVGRNRSSAVIGEALGLAVPSTLMGAALPSARRALAYMGVENRVRVHDVKDGARDEASVKQTHALIPMSEVRDYLTSRSAAYTAMGRALAELAGRDEKAVAAKLKQVRQLPVCIETIHAFGGEAEEYWGAVIKGATRDERWHNISEVRGYLLAGPTRLGRPGSASYRARMCALGWMRRGDEKKMERTKLAQVELEGCAYDGQPFVIQV